MEQKRNSPTPPQISVQNAKACAETHRSKASPWQRAADASASAQYTCPHLYISYTDAQQYLRLPYRIWQTISFPRKYHATNPAKKKQKNRCKHKRIATQVTKNKSTQFYFMLQWQAVHSLAKICFFPDLKPPVESSCQPLELFNSNYGFTGKRTPQFLTSSQVPKSVSQS